MYRSALGLAVAGMLLCLPPVARAQATFFIPRTILADFFPKSQRVSFRKFDLSPELRQHLEKRLGYPLPRTSYTVYVAQSDAVSGSAQRGGAPVIDGYAIIDEEMGEHLPITYAVKFSPSGTVLRQEIMVYRERYGDEVRDPRFRQQFVGKTSQSPLRPGEDIVAVSGATISSRALALGVRRDVLLIDELLVKPGMQARADNALPTVTATGAGQPDRQAARYQ